MTPDEVRRKRDQLDRMTLEERRREFVLAAMSEMDARIPRQERLRQARARTDMFFRKIGWD